MDNSIVNGETTSSLERIRGVRKLSKSDPVLCPVCGVTIRTENFEQHLQLEIERLDKASASTSNYKSRKSNGCSSTADPSAASTSSSSQQTSSPPLSDSSKNAKDTWQTYQKIKTNRQARLKVQSRKRKNDESSVCPVCNKVTMEDIQIHVENCLRKSEKKAGKNGTKEVDEDDEDESMDDSIDVEHETVEEWGNMEEYEWGGQTRIRTSSLVPGGYSSLGIGTNAGGPSHDHDEDLNVDGDDTQIYGPPQFAERDVILPSESDFHVNKKDQYLRSLVIGIDRPSSSANPSIVESQTDQEDSNDKKEEENLQPMNVGGDQLVESLKAKIREYEISIINKCKCQICLEDYKSPTVSICCWHVLCETCWLKTLGARKLCPKCNMITSPADLRRIYL